jgi:hypothetical protein
MEPTALASFVRDVLGCACPDEVLRSITVDRGHLVPGLDVEVTRLDVGGRLLVWVVPASVTQPVPALVAVAVDAGIAERDRRACHRFRLVLAAADPAAIDQPARDAFAACEQVDDRVHLHVVAVEDCPGSVGDS